MSRSGYSDECDRWAFIRWRGAVSSAIRGARGQRFLKELLAALEAMPEKKLIKESFVDETGCCCALGAIGKARGIHINALLDAKGSSSNKIAELFLASEALVSEIMEENDRSSECWLFNNETDEERWRRMVDWVRSNISST